jgi:hypothetical protein
MLSNQRAVFSIVTNAPFLSNMVIDRFAPLPTNFDVSTLHLAHRATGGPG